MSDYGASDYYIAQIQRLEADRNFWQAAATADERKIAQLEADLRKARAELDAMNKWQHMIGVDLRGFTLYVATSGDGCIDGIYCEPMQNIEDFLSPSDFYAVCSQIDDMAAEDAAEDAADDRIYRSGDHA